MSSPDGAPGAHVAPELLAALAMGDEALADPVTDARVREHVAACAACAAEVTALSEALDLVGASRHDSLVAPPPSVWAGVLAQLDDGPVDGAAPVDEPVGQPVPQPVDGAREEIATVTPLRRRRRGVPTWVAGAAAAVALAAGIGLGAWVVQPDAEAPEAPQAQVVGTTSLVSLDDDPSDRGAAEVRREDGHLVLHVEATDLDGPDGTREVWLINVDGERMVSLGMLPAGESGDFDFPERLLEQGYRIVDISYEPDDGDPLHSGQSLARGELTST